MDVGDDPELEELMDATMMPGNIMEELMNANKAPHDLIEEVKKAPKMPQNMLEDLMDTTKVPQDVLHLPNQTCYFKSEGSIAKESSSSNSDLLG